MVFDSANSYDINILIGKCDLDTLNTPLTFNSNPIQVLMELEPWFTLPSISDMWGFGDGDGCGTSVVEAVSWSHPINSWNDIERKMLFTDDGSISSPVTMTI